MEEADKRKLIDYWRTTASHDFDTMQSLYNTARYDATLFFGHMVLEKILKALVVWRTGDHAPYTHNLMHLAECAELTLSQEDGAFLREANMFNIEARYPEEKLRFYKLCTREYTDEKLQKIVKIYDTICQELKQNI